MLREMTSKQIADWIAYNELEPFGEWQGFYQAGIIASTVCNMFRGKNTKLLTPKDFIPTYDRIYSKANEQDLQEQIFAAFSSIGIVKKKKKKRKHKKRKK